MAFRKTLLATSFALASLLTQAPGGLASTPPLAQEDERPAMERLLQLAQNYSCTPRRYCSRNISTCAEARWYFRNCSWGGALDGDNDGIPCENLC